MKRLGGKLKNKLQFETRARQRRWKKYRRALLRHQESEFNVGEELGRLRNKTLLGGLIG